MKKEVTVFCPASVSNVGPGFDLLGFALERPGDELVVRRNDEGKLRLFDQSGTGLPADPAKNVAAIAASALLEELGVEDGFDLVFVKKINPGSGLGSSAASSVAAVVGINELLGAPLSTPELLPYAMEGEEAASGSYHADNIAPALLGGFTLIRGYDPLDIKHIPYPDDLWCGIVHPNLKFKTSDGRKLIPDTVPLSAALAQAGNLAGLIAGLTTNDHGLIGRSVVDLFAEPYRTDKLPEFDLLRKKTIDTGALGSGLSGSGPAVFSLCRSEEIASAVAKTMQAHFDEHGIGSSIYISRVSEAGCRVR
ncbi:MAG: homoserine kinase [Bacteroidales bacterium]